MMVFGASKYERDHATSLCVHEFLMRDIYPHISNDVIDVEDDETQLKGVDVFIDGIAYDEKATEYYDEHKKAYFFELSLTNQHGRRKCGWFLDKNKITEKYVVCWYKRRGDEIIEAEILFLDRRKLTEMFESRKYPLRANGPAPECSFLWIVRYDDLLTMCDKQILYRDGEVSVHDLA